MAGWAALILVVLPLAHAAGPVGLALDTTCTNAECYMIVVIVVPRVISRRNFSPSTRFPRRSISTASAR